MMRMSPGIFLPLLALLSCSSAQEERTVQEYDSSLDCLNGTSVVSLEGRYGLVDSTGREILPAVYDELYYLTDELAVAFSGGECEFFDRSGRRLAASQALPGTDADELLALYRELREEGRALWDNILEKYSRFHDYCRSGDANAEQAALMAEDIRESLRLVTAPMEKDQQARFEAAGR